jgi:hypothetical protein
MRYFVKIPGINPGIFIFTARSFHLLFLKFLEKCRLFLSPIWDNDGIWVTSVKIVLSQTFFLQGICLNKDERPVEKCLYCCEVGVGEMGDKGLSPYICNTRAF